MAPSQHARHEDASGKPFADYFWIAGLDGEELLEAYKTRTAALDHTHGPDTAADRRMSMPITEDVLTEEKEETSSIAQSPVLDGISTERDPYKRLSNLSDEARRSIQSLDGIASLQSNRSSATIRPNVGSGQQSPGYRASMNVSNADFTLAMDNFIRERDTFFVKLSPKDELNTPSPQTKPKTRAQLIVAEQMDTAPSRSVVGSVKRHISFREMNSAKRQTSMARGGSARASKRISSYNAVIPKPNTITSSPNEHPLKRTFEPVLLDRYPRPSMTNELKRRDGFPDYVPMFAFPNDINVVSSDSRPPSTWHEFSMTAADNSKIPAVCVIVWIPMSRHTADELEKLCERWRKANMTDEEREIAASLAERLADARAKLSRLLAKLPTAAQGSSERDKLEEHIGEVEEMINMMSEMLRPLRHGAASRIEGLTDGDTGLWIPRAYGLIGKDEALTPVWKQWLKAVTVPMLDGTVLRVPPSSPRIGMWQPLERYVHNICCDAPRPMSSKVQVELIVRELRLYAKKEACNELPGSRSTDLYPLFRALTIPNIILVFEYLLAEARMILVSSHASMLKLVGKALLELMWPLEWAGVYIPVLPARLIQVLEAPCPYICGVVRRGDLVLPDDDFVMVDLDCNELRATEHPPSLPKQHRRKLSSLLYLAAPHHNTRGVPVGPPAYMQETHPYNMFVAENTSLFSPATPSTNLSHLASLSSTLFGAQAAQDQIKRVPLLNAFLHAGPGFRVSDRPNTASTARKSSHPDSDQHSPTASQFPPVPFGPGLRSDSGYALQASLRDKRSGHQDNWDKKSSNFSSMRRKASLPFVRHGASPSIISVSPATGATSSYAASSYAQSTLAASTIMPGMSYQPVRNTSTTMWMEGHCMQFQAAECKTVCLVCDDKPENGYYRCTGCPMVAHGSCVPQITVVCQSAFYPDQIRAAFARFFASLFYSYRKYITPADAAQKKLGMARKLNTEAWFRSLPSDHTAYMEVLNQTQAFNEWIAEREQATAMDLDTIMLLDALIMSKKGRTGKFRTRLGELGLRGSTTKTASRTPSGTSLDFVGDTTSHVWRLVTTPMSNERPDLSASAAKGRDYHTIVKRAPAKLEYELFKRTEKKRDAGAKNEPMDKASIIKRMNGLSMNAP